MRGEAIPRTQKERDVIGIGWVMGQVKELDFHRFTQGGNQSDELDDGRSFQTQLQQFLGVLA